MTDNYEAVNHPKHYTSHPSGIECIDITEHFGCCVASAFKYVWRCGLKPGQSVSQELDKAIWYLERRLEFVKKHSDEPCVPTSRAAKVEDMVNEVRIHYSNYVNLSMLWMFKAEFEAFAARNIALENSIESLKIEKSRLNLLDDNKAQRIVDNEKLT